MTVDAVPAAGAAELPAGRLGGALVFLLPPLLVLLAHPAVRATAAAAVIKSRVFIAGDLSL
jgi:hypothetical protein